MSETHEVHVSVNGQRHTVSVQSRETLADLLRERLGLTGTHVGCEHGACGSCTVAMNGQAVRSCLTLAVQAEAASVTTVEAMSGEDGELGWLQQAFWDNHSFQCAFCAPGFLMTLHCFLARNPAPSEDELLAELSGNLCRCTGYKSILDGVRTAIRRRCDGAHGGSLDRGGRS